MSDIKRKWSKLQSPDGVSFQKKLESMCGMSVIPNPAASRGHDAAEQPEKIKESSQWPNRHLMSRIHSSYIWTYRLVKTIFISKLIETMFKILAPFESQNQILIIKRLIVCFKSFEVI